VLSGEETNTNFIVLGLTRSGLEPTIYHTLEAITPTITPLETEQCTCRFNTVCNSSQNFYLYI